MPPIAENNNNPHSIKLGETKQAGFSNGFPLPENTDAAEEK